ncbi:MAG TPA: transcriptional regulator, partial [Gammaproteobacteria bacterium]|nr:transcriptional regulator [Gammaproteobacteria bacterium]
MSTLIRPIRNEDDYNETLERISVLMDIPDRKDELEVLATLVEKYEAEHFPIDKPDPIEAIKFRMEQMDLTNRDLIPLIGSRSKVSEVLSGKCKLTLKMIRALNKSLKIPAEILLQETRDALPADLNNIEWEKFPLTAMAKLGWIEKVANLKGYAEEIMRDFINRAGGMQAIPSVLFRKNDHLRQNAKMNKYSLAAWCLQVLITARKNVLPLYEKGSVTLDFIKYVATLSSFSEGPKLAKEYLEKHGIHLIYVPHLPQTYLDGAVLQLSNGSPVIGLTLRYDRVDNFWFCLCHELGHIGRHLDVKKDQVFIDDLTTH